ncbi:MAG: AraC family transcriptional regulator [Spirochaetales bacterium]
MLEDDISQKLRLLHDVTGLDVVYRGAEGTVVSQVTRLEVPPSLTLGEADWEQMATLLEREVPVSASSSGHLEYVVVPCRGEGAVALGPFRTVPVTTEEVIRLMSQHRLPPVDRLSLSALYESLPLVGSRYASSLGPWVQTLLDSARPLAEMLYFRSAQQKRKPELPSETSMLDQHTIEKRYRVEAAIRRAVETGSHELYDAVMHKDGTVLHIEDRVENNPLRSAKNISFVYNTLLRTAAQRGGLHPVLLHQISARYAVEIEACKTATEVYRLHDTMAQTYLEAVNQNRREGLTPVTRKVVDHIVLHLHEDLSSAHLATRFGMSPSHLANRFRTELKVTFTEFVQARRVDEAAHLLQWSNLSMKEIAAFVGFHDANHFSRKFRQVKGSTPSEFRRSRPEASA